MKKATINGLLLVFGFFLCGTINAQEDTLDKVKEAINAGSSKELAQYLNQNVDVTMEGEMQSYSKTQAEYVIRDFFKEHPPTHFQIDHKGSSKGGVPYAIGEYVSKDNIYRVWMILKNTNNQYLIHEISFLKE